MPARPHQLELLEKFVYGRRLPGVPVSAQGEVERADVRLAGDVPATRIQARLRLGHAADANVVEVLLYLPKGVRPAPVFLGLNFLGNHAEHPDPGIRLSRAWMPDDAEARIVDHRATEASRGRRGQGFPVEQMLSRGYGMATASCGDIFPDRPDGRSASVLASLGRPVAGDLPADEPGAIAAWAWGLSRILDWLVTLPEVDATKVVVAGHSRLGKAALWAAACDERFAAVVSNESGAGGAALWRGSRGESVDLLARARPHWFCPAFATFADREAEMPTDQHALLALAAPRPLYVASAIDDRWADPRGEFRAAVAAEPAWRIFGLDGLGTTDWPPTDTPVGRTVGYHVRSGRHDLIDYDWQRFADFAARVNSALPQTSWGIRAAGDPAATISRVAVCGGSGDSLLPAARAAGVQAYVTADLRHHPADEHRRASDVGLIDVAHWASEYPWCSQAAGLLRDRFGDALPVTVSGLRTDPWNIEIEGAMRVVDES